MNKCTAIIGSSGSGKSLALDIINKAGFFTKDYDLFSTKIILNDCCVHEKIKEITNIKFKNNDFKILKEIGEFFDFNPDKEYIFEKWFQPYLGEIIKKDLRKIKNSKSLYIDMPFIEEKQLLTYMDSIWIMQASQKTCFERIKKRNNYYDNKIKYLISRSKLSWRCFSYADFIINNNCNNIDTLKIKIFNLISHA